MTDPYPHCGPTCYGGAAHNARREDGVMYSDTKPHAELPGGKMDARHHERYQRIK